MTDLLNQFSDCPPAERIQLAEDLWDSVASSPDELPALTEEQHAEIDRRLADHERNPDAAVPWDEVRARLIARFG